MKTKAPYIIAGLGIVIVILALVIPSITQSKYLRSAKAGGDYLVRQMHEDGSFVYDYDPLTGDESPSYNILRHAGTAYSLIDLYEATGDEQYLRAGEKALTYLDNQIIPCPELVGGQPLVDAACVEEDGEIKLGGNALAILAFTEHTAVTGSKQYLPRAQQLARFVVSTQRQNGEFSVHKIDSSSGAPEDFESGYYPGEALFALARLSAVDHDSLWINAAHNAAHWIIDVRDANIPTKDLNHDHWLLYGLSELYTDRPDKEYLAHAKRIVESIAASQHPSVRSGETVDHPEWAGGFYEPPRSTPTATRSEGLGAAYTIFTRAGEEAYATVVKDVMRKAIDFELRTQFTATQLALLGADMTAQGAFHSGLDTYDVRIDYIQHNISALLAFDRIENGE